MNHKDIASRCQTVWSAKSLGTIDEVLHDSYKIGRKNRASDMTLKATASLLKEAKRTTHASGVGGGLATGQRCCNRRQQVRPQNGAGYNA